MTSIRSTVVSAAPIIVTVRSVRVRTHKRTRIEMKLHTFNNSISSVVRRPLPSSDVVFLAHNISYVLFGFASTSVASRHLLEERSAPVGLSTTALSHPFELRESDEIACGGFTLQLSDLVVHYQLPRSLRSRGRRSRPQLSTSSSTVHFAFRLRDASLLCALLEGSFWHSCSRGQRHQPYSGPTGLLETPSASLSGAT